MALMNMAQYEYGHKYTQQNASDPNPAAYKKHYSPQPSRTYPRNTRLVQLMKINVIYILIKEEINPHDHLNRYRKGM